MAQDRFSNEKYVDWVKVKLSLQYAKEGLEPTTEQNVATFYNSLSSRLQAPSSSSASGGPITCNSCVKADLKRQWSRQRFTCISGICDRWLNLLQQDHVDPTSTVEWDNFDVSRLPLSPWECAKVYLPYGSRKVQCAGDCDLAAILTLYLNCRHFASILQDINLCGKVKEVRNGLLHSGTMEVDRPQMMSNVGLIKQLLSDPAFAAYWACREAVAKIDQLIMFKLELSLNKELELKVLNSDIKLVASETDQLKQDMDHLTNQVQQFGKLRTDVSGATTEVSRMKDQLGGVTTDVSSLKDQLGGVTTDVSSLKDQLKTAVDNIVELQKVSDQLYSFINTCNIEKVDKEQLAASISTLSTMRAETDRQGQILAQLQETVGRHDVTLEQHREALKQHKGTWELHEVKLQQHSGALEQHGGTLEQHEGTLEQHGGTLDQQRGTLEQHGGILEQHGGTLEHHERRLEQHEGILQQHRVVQEHSERKQLKIESDLANLRDILLSVYKDTFQRIPIYLLKPSWKHPVKNIYVSQEMKLVDFRGKPEKPNNLNEHCDRRENKEDYEKESKDKIISTIHDIFYKDGQICKDVYVSAEAGLGKTTLCEHLVKLWCDAHTESDGNRLEHDEDLRTMSEFQLLFYINLGKVKLSKDFPASKDEIAMLIHDQLQLSAKAYSPDDITTYLCNTCTLVLMDSLDESNSPRLPLRGLHNKSCIVTTSRPWKLEAFRSKIEGNIDQQIEIVGLKEKSSNDLAENVVKILNKEFNKSKSSERFISDMKSQGLEEFLNTPMMIIQMLSLWFDGETFGSSQYEIYCRIVHHQIITAVRAKELVLPECTADTTTTFFHICCRKDHCPCASYEELLLKVTQLAYCALFGENREMSLVFDHRTTTYHGLSENDIDICLKIGFLTQHKLFVESLSEEKKTVSFLHKTNQEFFASIFLSGGDQQEMDLVKSYVNNDLLRGLELDKVFMFCSQSDQTVTRKLTRLIYDIADCDERVQKYRQSGEYDDAPNKDLVYKIQKILFASVKTRKPGRSIASKIKHFFISSNKQTQNPPSRQAAESSTSIAQNRSGSTPKLIMADIILGEPQWRRTIVIDDRRLVEALDMAELKSARINAEYADFTIWKLLEQETRSLQSLVVGNGEKTNVKNIHGVVVRNQATLRTLGLHGWLLDPSGCPLDLSGLGNKVSVMLTCDLTCLLLHSVKLSHEQCVMLVQRLSEKQNLQRLTLEVITCQTHGMYSGECCDVKLQSRLEHVKLWVLPFRDVSFHTEDLKTCKIELGDNVPAATSALSCLTSASNLREFTCGGLRGVASVQKLVAVLPRLHGLQRIVLGGIDFGSEREIRLSAAAKTLESVELWHYSTILDTCSTITADGLESLVESVKAPRVEITLDRVTIRDRDPRDFLQRLRKSPDYEVTEDRGVEYRERRGGLLRRVVEGEWEVVRFVFYKNK